MRSLKFPILILFISFTMSMFASAFAADESENLPFASNRMWNKKNTYALGYDEGLAFKYQITDDIAAYTSLMYKLNKNDSTEEALHYFSAKLGADYRLFKSKRVVFPLFLEAKYARNKEVYKAAAGEIYGNDHALEIRLGMKPELFITKRLSIGYKIGLKLGFLDRKWALNPVTKTVENVSGAQTYFSVFGLGNSNPETAAPKLQLLESIFLYYYF